MAARQGPVAPFKVRGRRRNGTITYLCPDADWVLRKLGDFERAGYTDIAVLDATGKAIGPAQFALEAGDKQTRGGSKREPAQP